MVTTAIGNQYRHFEKEILGIFAGHYNFEDYNSTVCVCVCVCVGGLF
jgi:hypothetical protein